MSERPALSTDLSASVFWNWYWTREEMADFCRSQQWRQDGSKADLFARIHAHLSGEEDPTQRRKRCTGAVNWARDPLTPQTRIDVGVSFGPNFRRFMAAQVGPGFSCHRDFMAWVRAHPGSTLSEAISAWRALEARKDDPEFRREIATDNQYLQYVRDFLDACPGKTASQAREAWLARRAMPAPAGRIAFEQGDIELNSSRASKPRSEPTYE
ncbi:MAG: DUF6434 domain-containing protein [Pseudomonadota bacterium]